jgi:hypothetical protein
MFADPQRVQSVKKEDFVKVLPKRKELFKSVGLVSSNIESLETSKLDSKFGLSVWSSARLRLNRFQLRSSLKK